MIVTTSVRESDWRNLLGTLDDPNIFQSPEMAHVFQESEGYRSLVLGALRQEELVALLSVAIINYGPRGLPVVGTRTVATGGPIGDPAAFPVLTDRLDQLLSRSSELVQFRNLRPPSDVASMVSRGYEWQDHLNYVVEIAKGEESVLKGMSKGRRYNIRLADRDGVSLVELTPERIVDAYRMLEETYKRARMPLARISLFQRAHAVLAPKGKLWALGAIREGTLCAAIFVLSWDGTAFNWYNGSTDLGWRTHGNEWLVWQSMRVAMEHGCIRYDLGGAGRPGSVYGPGEFKKHFGGMEINPGRFEKRYHPWISRLTTAAFGLWRDIY